jgi:hypothetical protein
MNEIKAAAGNLQTVIAAANGIDLQPGADIAE